MKNMVGKIFIFNQEEWTVEEVLLYEYTCICRNLNNDIKEYFRCEYVQDKIKSYDHDLKELEKDRDPIIIKEDDEKELLLKIIQFYKHNSNMSDLTPFELKSLSAILEKFFVS
uniref:hypothetical protein n=1 Tax=Clostridioides difficile TaxID=1496 RepID=UPI0031B599A1